MKTGPFFTALAVVLTVFVLLEANSPNLDPQSQLAIFAALGLVACFLTRPLHPKLAGTAAGRALDVLFAALSVVACGWMVVQNEPLFQRFWIGGQTLGNRAGQESTIDLWIGGLGLLLVLEATRRAIGWALPLLSLTFVAYAWFGPYLPDWAFPHRGYGVERIVGQAYLHSQGVYGTALRVMFAYVFLFVVFGALLKETGATGYIIRFAQRVFRNSPGGPAKVAVLSSGLMGSLSGSAVANTATTGTFTIPMMRSSGFKREIAGGIEAAASSGGALVPPVMGAGAYMMLEIVDPPVTYLQIVRAALIPAIVYYLSLILIVHFYSRRIGLSKADPAALRDLPGDRIANTGHSPGLVFLASFAVLVGLLLSGYTVIRAVSVALVAIPFVAALHPSTRLGLAKFSDAMRQSARDVVPLVAAAACVGIVIGIVTLTGIGSKLPSTILDLSQGSLLAALVLIMVSSIVLGMGLPSAVCYLLMATLIGPALGDLGVVPLAAHLFIFYFGMMSMVTPPVALAAYTAGTIAEAGIMQTGVAAFRFALVGFTLPYMFVFHPEILMLAPDGGAASVWAIAAQTTLAVAGVTALAVGIAGHMVGPARGLQRLLFYAAAAALLLPGRAWVLGLPAIEVAGFAALLSAIGWNVAAARRRRSAAV